MPLFFAVFFISLLSLFFLKKLGIYLSWVSKPSLIVGSREGIPLTGGWLLFPLTIFSLWYSQFSLWVIAGAMIVFFMGILDDFLELSPLPKLFLQSVSAFLVMAGSLHTTIGRIPSFLNYLITFLWIIGITNAFNFLDILDGLAPVVGIFPFLGIMIVSKWNGNSSVFLVSGVLLSYLFSFLFYNLPPASLFLGNAGSYLMGFLLSFLVFPLSFAPPGREIALVTPLLLLGLPLIDTFYLVIRRISQKRPIYRKSEDHMALVLLKKGWGVRKVVSFMGILSGILTFSGVLITRMENIFSLFYLTFLGAFLGVLLKKVLR